MFAMLTAAACGQTTGAGRTDQPTASISDPDVYRVPEDVLRDPAKRFDVMNQLARSIYSKTRNIDDVRYANVVRPSVLAQLRTAGFSVQDAELILNRSDTGHPVNAAAKSPGGGGPTRAP
jgi:hypothetical protein